MDADLDLLLIAVYCTVDDLLPKRPGNARRRISDAEVITLCIAQAIWAFPPTRGSWRPRAGVWGTCFPTCRSAPRFTSVGCDSQE